MSERFFEKISRNVTDTEKIYQYHSKWNGDASPPLPKDMTSTKTTQSGKMTQVPLPLPIGISEEVPLVAFLSKNLASHKIVFSLKNASKMAENSVLFCFSSAICGADFLTEDNFL